MTTIDWSKERVLTFKEAAASLPQLRGRKVHVGTVYRWSSRGLRGVRLETIRIGGTVCTSREALQRFFARLSGDAVTEPRPSVAQEMVQRALEKEGF